MKKLLLLTAGGAVGYVLGAKAGRERYESIKDKAVTVKERSPAWMDKARDLKGKSEHVVEDVHAKMSDSPTDTSNPSRTQHTSPLDLTHDTGLGSQPSHSL